MPGPGNYNPNLDASRETGGAMGIGTGTRAGIAKKSDEPGPGHYDNIRSSDNLYCRPNYAFGKGDRSDSSP